MPKKDFRTVYFDEAGFTGPNLTDESQPYFTYCGFQIEDDELEEAETFIDKINTDHNIQGNELKGSKLCNSTNGQKLIKLVFDKYKSRSKLILHEKKYALAGKFYEYIFEPILAKNSLFFYNIGFHLFITNNLYIYYKSQGKNAELIYDEIQKYFKSEGHPELFKGIDIDSKDLVLQNIKEFAQINSHKCKEEFEDYDNSKWILDLSVTSLVSILRILADENNIPNKVICDESKPIYADRDIFEHFIGDERDVYTELMGSKTRLTFNMKESLHFGSSHDLIGLQLADLFASTLNFALKNKEHEFSKYIFNELSLNIIGEFSVFFSPWKDFDYAMNDQNLGLLLSMNKFGREGNDILDGIHKLLTEEDPMF